MKSDEEYCDALLQLDDYLTSFEDHDLREATRSLETLAETRETVTTAGAWRNALLGYALMLQDRTAEAIRLLEVAHRHAPDDEEIDLLHTALIVDAGDEARALEAVAACAERRGLNLEGLKEEILAVNFTPDARTLLLNGFPNVRNLIESRIHDDAEAIRNRDPDRAARMREQARADCDEALTTLRESFDESRVPEQLRHLTPWALHLGVGDDVCRPALAAALSRDDAARFVAEVNASAAEIDSWLDSFGNDLSFEAAAFMYMALAVEEM